jgi:uncharacterized protein (TIGR02118 family)
MVSYFVRYRGSPASPEQFLAHYESRHAEILRQFPAIRSLILHQPTGFSDPFPVRSGGTFLLAQMTFDSPADLNTALRSQARALARQDFQKFPVFDGEITHEAMRGKVIF